MKFRNALLALFSVAWIGSLDGSAVHAQSLVGPPATPGVDWQLAYTVDAATGVVYQLRDLDGDGVVQSAGECRVFYDATSPEVDLHLGAAHGLTVLPNGTVLVGDLAQDRILALRDIDLDGDANDAGEATVFFDDASLVDLEFAALGEMEALADGTVVMTDLGGGSHDDRSVLRLEDLDGDGYCIGTTECRVLYSVDTTSGATIERPCALATTPDGTLWVSDLVTDAIFHLFDTPGLEDGDANDPGEQLVVATTAAGGTPLVVLEHLVLFGDSLLGSEPPTGTVTRWTDADESGLFDAGEATVYWDSASDLDPVSPRGLALLSSSAVLIAESGLSGRLVRLEDLNRDGDANDPGEARVFLDGSSASGASFFSLRFVAVFFGSTSLPTLFLRGDVNGDGSTDVSDAIRLLEALFVPGAAPVLCPDAADLDDGGEVDVADVVRLLSALFVPGSPPLPEPALACGPDPTTDALAPCSSIRSACP